MGKSPPLLEVSVERWPIAGRFTIARGSRTEADVVVARVSDGEFVGCGECVPYARYGESVDSVVAQLQAQTSAVARGLAAADLVGRMPAGAARNALDAALLNVHSHRCGQSSASRLGLPPARAVTTAYTLSLDEPGAMFDAAQRASTRPVLKVKLGAAGDAERIAAVRRGAPAAKLLADANEGWTEQNFDEHLRACAQAGVALIEQPLPATQDAVLEGFASPVPLCADESFHGLDGLDQVARRYRFVNVKLDKTGGLTAAVTVARAAAQANLGLMVGCMVGTSLAMAPAFALTPWAQFVDLDGPLLLARDREPGIRYDGSTMHPPPAELWV
jgi:L-Ala-D/L-Glu epimerase